MTYQQRATEVIDDLYSGSTPTEIAAALAAEGVLLYDDTKRLVTLGEAVERVQAWHHDPPPGEHDGWSMCLDAIYREAEQQP